MLTGFFDIRPLFGAAFVPFPETLIMEDNKKEQTDTTKKNEHTDMPVKTVATDHQKNSAGETGLNQSRTDANEMEPGTKSEDPKSWETD